MSTAPTPQPVITSLSKLTINLTLQDVLLTDLNTYWKTMDNGTAAQLTADMSATDTTFTVAQLTPPVSSVNPFANGTRAGVQTAATPAVIAVGCTVLIDSEGMLVTAISGSDANSYTITVARSVLFQQPAPHTAGVSVDVLQYTSAVDYLSMAILLPAIQKAQTTLGSASALYQVKATGSVISNVS